MQLCPLQYEILKQNSSFVSTIKSLIIKYLWSPRSHDNVISDTFSGILSLKHPTWDSYGFWTQQVTMKYFICIYKTKIWDMPSPYYGIILLRWMSSCGLLAQKLMRCHGPTEDVYTSTSSTGSFLSTPSHRTNCMPKLAWWLALANKSNAGRPQASICNPKPSLAHFSTHTT